MLAYLHSIQNLLSFRLRSKNVKIKIYKIVILGAVLYGSQGCSLTLREEHRLRVFESKVLRRTLGSKRDEIIGNWKKKKLHNEELHNLYISQNYNSNDQVKENEMCRARSTKGT
jgi:hypothetical protein